MKGPRLFINILRVIGYSELVICIIMMLQEMEKKNLKAIGPAVLALIIALVLLELNTMLINIKNKSKK